MAVSEEVRQGDSRKDDLKRRYVEYIRVQGLDGKYIDRDKEKKILEAGVTRFEMGLDDSRAVMLGVASEHDFIFEKEAQAQAEKVLGRLAGKKGRIGKKEFNDTAGILQDFSNGHLKEAEARKCVKRIMEENDWKPKRAGIFQSRRWYKKIEV